MLAATVAACMSSLDSVFTAAASLFCIDLWKGVLRPRASGRELVAVGRVFCVVLAVVTILWLPVVELLSDQVFVYIQSVSMYLAPPIAASTSSACCGGAPTPTAPPPPSSSATRSASRDWSARSSPKYAAARRLGRGRPGGDELPVRGSRPLLAAPSPHVVVSPDAAAGAGAGPRPHRRPAPPLVQRLRAVRAARAHRGRRGGGGRWRRRGRRRRRRQGRRAGRPRGAKGQAADARCGRLPDAPHSDTKSVVADLEMSVTIAGAEPAAADAAAPAAAEPPPAPAAVTDGVAARRRPPRPPRVPGSLAAAARRGGAGGRSTSLP